MEKKEELIILAASKVHEDWCYEELKAYFNRAQTLLKAGMSLVDSLKKACYKGEQKRNELLLDDKLISIHQKEFDNCLETFEEFISLIYNNVIVVKRFTKRNLTEEEQKNAGENYKVESGEENILRTFISLSSESKKENLEAALGAYNVYVELSKAGITIEEMETNPKIINMIGIAIHADWLKRNINHPNNSLKIPYSQLDSWTQQQDITVFNALLNVVKQNKERYLIPAESGFILPNYNEVEVQVLEEIQNKTKRIKL